MAAELVDSGAQPERTSLSWLRTGASVAFAALFLFRYLVEAGLQTQAFLLGGIALLVAPLLLLTGAARSAQASKNWEQASPVQSWKTMFVSVAVSSVGLVFTLFLVLIAL